MGVARVGAAEPAPGTARVTDVVERRREDVLVAVTRVETKVDALIEHVKKQNGRIGDLEGRTDSLESTRDKQAGAFEAGRLSFRAVVGIAGASGATATVCAFLLVQVWPRLAQ